MSHSHVPWLPRCFVFTEEEADIMLAESVIMYGSGASYDERLIRSVVTEVQWCCMISMHNNGVKMPTPPTLNGGTDE